MKKFFAFAVLFALIAATLNAQELSGRLEIVKKSDHGMRCLLDGVRNVLFVEGTAEEMGTAHGQLYADGIAAMFDKVEVVGSFYDKEKGESYVEVVREAERRTTPFVPERYLREIDAMGVASGLSTEQVHLINFYTELFHCSGFAVRGKATKDGRVLHARVLDYMTNIGMQDWATFMVFLPTEKVEGKSLNAWMSASSPGFVGSVTCMNEKGLSFGELGVGGQGKWDGLPMVMMMRRVMEECSTVEEAITLMKSTPLTCQYAYVLADATGDIASILAFAGTPFPVLVIRAGEDFPKLPIPIKLPGVLEDVVYLSGAGERFNTLHARLKENFGSIDEKTMMEIIKRPVCMKSNLHDVIFEPKTLDFWAAEAGKETVAADEPYIPANLGELIKFYRANK